MWRCSRARDSAARRTTTISYGPGQAITVYTRNLYLGSEITPLAAIPSPAAIPGVAATLWANIQASDFPERAKVLADEIVALAPDLVALQEVTLYRRQIPSDFQPGDDVPNATEVVLDFLAILMAEIDARGGGYRVVGEAVNVDAEVPVDGGAAGPFDLRLTDRDVMLARDTVQTSNFVALPFAAKFEFVAGGSGGIPIALTRSTSRVDAVLGDAHFTFGNAHLEIQSPAAVPDRAGDRDAVGDRVGAGSGAAARRLQQRARDEFVPAADGAVQRRLGRRRGRRARLHLLPGRQPDEPGIHRRRIASTWCSTVGGFRVNDMAVTGTDPATGRTPGGLWASDHFGVLAHVELVP